MATSTPVDPAVTRLSLQRRERPYGRSPQPWAPRRYAHGWGTLAGGLGAAQRTPSVFIACGLHVFMSEAWERSAPLRYAHRREGLHVPANGGEESRAAELVKATPCGVLRTP